MIDYDHLQGGSPCNANLSDMEGGFEAHWTFGDNGETVTQARALTDEGFALLWDGIAASVSGDGVFGRCLVADPTRLIDPDHHHVITTTQVQDGQVRHRTFMVPVGETDLAFTTWLEALAVPGGSRHDDLAPMCAPCGARAAQTGSTETEVRREKVPA